MLPDFKIDYKAEITKRMQHENKTRHVKKWNGIESPEANHLIWGHMTFNTGEKTIQWGKDNLTQKGARKNGYPHTKE